jgi:glycosyltransferase involved in cell wall biosynthesis
VTVVEIVFWVAVGLIVYTHAGYPLLLAALARLRPRPHWADSEPPPVTLVIAAHDERDVIAERVRNALALEYPGPLEVIVASDGSTDGTAEAARSAAAGDPRVRVLDLERQGKVRAQDTAVDTASGAVLAFSDANAFWESSALRALVRPFADPDVAYVCGSLAYLAPDGSNQEDTYWRYENGVRALESRLASVTAGNGAIYAVRRSDYLRLDPRTSHDLAFPFNLVRRGRRAVYEPAARAVEQPVATLEGEFRRKRRMMSHAWPAVLGGGLLDPRGYGPAYALEIYSHRALRYATPFLHVIAFGANLALLGQGTLYVLTLIAQLAVLAGAFAARGARPRALALCRYYVLMTASLAAGLWDWLRRGTPPTWEREGVR